MADIWTKRKRSNVMSLIRSHGNRSTELRLAAIFRHAGYTGWRRHQPVFGNPDFIFKRERIAIFVDGCFWHACPRCYRRPQSNQDYWDEKLRRNCRRDKLVTTTLRRQGWKVLRIWAHELSLQNEATLLKRIGRAFN